LWHPNCGIGPLANDVFKTSAAAYAEASSFADATARQDGAQGQTMPLPALRMRPHVIGENQQQTKHSKGKPNNDERFQRIFGHRHGAKSETELLIRR